MTSEKGTRNALVAPTYMDESKTWKDLQLDPRLLQAIDHLGFQRPTLIQSSAIPLALEENADIIAKSSTGSGKTAAYILPIIHCLLEDGPTTGIQCIILVPTRELAGQVTKLIEDILLYCNSTLKALNLSMTVSDQVLSTLLVSSPNILIATPARLIQTIEKKISDSVVDLKEVTKLVIDEVDLVLSYGYLDDIKKLEQLLPSKQTMQTFLMSATINDDINELKTRFCSRPVILKLNDEAISKSNLVQYYIKTTEFDKFLLAYVIFKLHLIKGKTIIFVNDIDRGYRLKLFMEQFGIRSCILNSELPINSRIHIVDQFNKNVYSLLIATDETESFTREVDEHDISEDETNEEDKDVEKKVKKTKASKNRKDKEYGVSRGVDFHNVACVLNFDLPKTSKAYVHRIGRTARAGKAGMALSFVIPSDQFGKHKVACLASSKKDEKILHRIMKSQAKFDFEIKPYQFDMKQVEGFRYRSEDAFRAVTSTAIREARIKELKNEIINSDKLKRFFEENPKDLTSLRHDKELHAVRVQSHLKRVPQYLLPEGARAEIKKVGFVPFHKKHRVNKKRGGKRGGKRSNPLSTFKR